MQPLHKFLFVYLTLFALRTNKLPIKGNRNLKNEGLQSVMVCEPR